VPPAFTRHRAVLPVGLLLAVAVALAACGGGHSAGDDRADQVRHAATTAGLSRPIADVLALAARGPTATYRITYAGTGGASIVVSQRDGDRRVDQLAGDTVVSSRILRHGVAYSCTLATATATATKGGLTCTRVAGDLTQGGQFTPAALTTFSQQLARSRDRFALRVTHRRIARTPVTCLESTPKSGGSAKGSTLCVSQQGAQLLVDANGQRVQASSYSTVVPASTFDVPRAADR
jgi:hypothetical protein